MPAKQTVTTTVTRGWKGKKLSKPKARTTKPRPKKGNPPKKKR